MLCHEITRGFTLNYWEPTNLSKSTIPLVQFWSCWLVETVLIHVTVSWKFFNKHTTHSSCFVQVIGKILQSSGTLLIHLVAQRFSLRVLPVYKISSCELSIEQYAFITAQLAIFATGELIRWISCMVGPWLPATNRRRLVTSCFMRHSCFHCTQWHLSCFSLIWHKRNRSPHLW